jgi:NAD(P)H dehydrogenase (quinone)
MGKILVTGSTGGLGSATIQFLNSLQEVVAFARDAPKVKQDVEIRTGDYDDEESLLKAMDGIDKLFLISGSDLEKRSVQQQRVIKAALQCGVKHIVYTSLIHQNDTPDSPVYDKTIAHLKTEALLKSSGIDYTILLNTLYAEIIPVFAGPALLETKTIFLPAGEGKVAYAWREDLAEASAHILADTTGRYLNQSITLTGAELVSWSDIASMIGAITHTDIQYVSPAVEAFKQVLIPSGLPLTLIDAIAGMQVAVSEGEYAVKNSVLEDILGRTPRSVRDFLEVVYGSK